MKHKHAEFFTAIANGESPNDWECYRNNYEGWLLASLCLTAIIFHPENWQVRRKQVMHEVNGFTVPAPLAIGEEGHGDGG